MTIISTTEDLFESEAQRPLEQRQLTLAEFNRLEREGFKLSEGDQRIHQRLKDEHMHAGIVAWWRKQLADIDAVRAATRERATRAQLVFSTAAPTAADDHLTIWDSGNRPDSGYPMHEWQLDDGRTFVFREPGQLLCHFVPRELAEQIRTKRGGHLPGGLNFTSVPRDLLGQLLKSGLFVRTSPTRVEGWAGGGGAVVDVSAVDNAGLLAVASAALRACSSIEVIERWLDSSQQGETELHTVFAIAVEKRLDELGYEFEEETESVPAAPDDAAPGDSDELAPAPDDACTVVHAGEDDVDELPPAAPSDVDSEEPRSLDNPEQTPEERALARRMLDHLKTHPPTGSVEVRRGRT